jgi:hypothetical protein
MYNNNTFFWSVAPTKKGLVPHSLFLFSAQSIAFGGLPKKRSFSSDYFKGDISL